MNENMMRESNTLTLESNGLRQRAAAGIEAMMDAAVRGLARAVELLVIFAFWILLPGWPVFTAVLVREGNYLRRYPTTLVRAMRHMRALWRTRAISRMVARRLGPPVSRVPERVVGGCTHCGQCCLNRACVFLAFDAQGRSCCRIYGTWAWKMLFANCSRYPLDGQEIALYRCPGFAAIRGMPANGIRVIPVVPVMQPAVLETIHPELSEKTAESGA